MLKDIQRRKLTAGNAAATTATAVAVANPQPVTMALPAAVAIQISPSNSGDEQVVSCNSSPAATASATPPPPLRACTSTPDILEENDRLRRENSQLSQELNRLRSLCSNIYSLMSSYAANPADAALAEGRAALVLMPEARAVAEECAAAAGGGRKPADEDEVSEEMCPRLFGVSIGLKRFKRCESVNGGSGDERTAARAQDVKSEPSDRGSSEDRDPMSHSL